MDSIQDILARYPAPEQPEIVALKQYIDEHFHSPVSVALNGNAIVVTVASAALANTLRLNSIAIQKDCKISRRLIFRIG